MFDSNLSKDSLQLKKIFNYVFIAETLFFTNKLNVNSLCVLQLYKYTSMFFPQRLACYWTSGKV